MNINILKKYLKRCIAASTILMLSFASVSGSAYGNISQNENRLVSAKSANAVTPPCEIKQISSRTDLINYLISTNNLQNYLEIGLNNPFRNFTKINCKNKTSVDPYITDGQDANTKENVKKWLPYCTHRMTSDEFFRQNHEKFDIVFIDGLHHENQVDKDIMNALKCLKTGGFIVVHDCLPPTENHQKVPRIQGAWNGTVWKSFVKISGINDGSVKTFVLDADWGCGIIKKLGETSYAPFAPLTMNWKYFWQNRYNLYNIIKPSEYRNIF